jgi:hypothetical protein
VHLGAGIDVPPRIGYDLRSSALSQVFSTHVFGGPDSYLRAHALLLLVGGLPPNVSALRNLAADNVRTRFIAAGIDVDRGDRLSDEALPFIEAAIKSVRTAESSKKYTEDGTVGGWFFIAPVLRGVSGEKAGISALAEGTASGQRPAVADGSTLKRLWWAATERYAFGKGRVATGADDLHQVKKEALVRTFIGTEGAADKQQQLDRTLYVADLIGPRGGMLTNLLVREIEELDGCLASVDVVSQLFALGYKAAVLGGAFVLETEDAPSETKSVCSKDVDKNVRDSLRRVWAETVEVYDLQ